MDAVPGPSPGLQDNGKSILCAQTLKKAQLFAEHRDINNRSLVLLGNLLNGLLNNV